MSYPTQRATAECRSLAKLVQATGLLSPDVKRQWLRILPYLNAADRDRLRQILVTGSASAESPTDRAILDDHR
ncbi:MAG TPA: hypothetical protein VNG11_02445 [Chloroflexota bacterium]|nr:hypothetical protein [Chloroflexota bacterium]